MQKEPGDGNSHKYEGNSSEMAKKEEFEFFVVRSEHSDSGKSKVKDDPPKN
ncbi:MAG: hypothetical protein ACYDH8_07635 [Syntrophales bacterium]